MHAGKNNLSFELLKPSYEKNGIEFEVKESNQGDSLIGIIRIEKENGKIEDCKKIINVYAE
jgi:hypothetical protein